MSVARPGPDERRAEPRAYGTLDVRYHRGRPEDAEAWLAGGGARGAERRPDPTMSFSPAGLAFDDRPACADGDVLLLDLGIPGEPARWRAIGRVLRVSPIPIDERDEHVDATHRIAVSLTALADEAERALRAYTTRVRQANGHAGEGAR